ncbi:MAG TPA: hypothetical protein P5075_04350 [Eubacteriales bacterium]|nr:hypothetical protein [Eubacteriales bacterium]
MNERTASAILGVSTDIWIRDMQHDTHRTARRLAELGGLFSAGAKQRRFFQLAEELLKTRSSEYYALLRSLCRNVDANALKTFGIAFGYYALSHGAAKRRAVKKDGQENVSFASFQRGAQADALENSVCLHAPLGTTAYLVFPDAQADSGALAGVMRAHKDCAFLLFDERSAFSENQPLNAMRFVPYQDFLNGTQPTPGSLCGAYAVYDDASLEQDLSEARLHSLSEAGCLFYVLTAKPGTCALTLARAGRAVSQLREHLPCPLFPVSLETDVEYVDAPIPQFLPRFAGAV